MNRYLTRILSLAFLTIAVTTKGVGCLDSCDYEANSRSYLAVRPHFQSASPEMVSAFRYDRTHARESGKHSAIQFVAFGSKSTNNDELARYFLSCAKTSLVVASADSIASGVEADLLTQHFNVFTQTGNYHSEISLCPKQSVVGFALHGRKSFCRNEENDRGFWASASIPIERVKNRMNLRETVFDDGNGIDETQDENVVANMIEAFNQEEWNSCRIACGSLDKTGVADIELKLGYEWLSHDPCHLESYIGLIAPAGNKPCGKYLWSPVVGNGNHFGIMTGGGFGVQIWEHEDGDRNLRVEFESNTRYLFSEKTCRCLDLKCKPLSRYIEVYKDLEEATAASNLTPSTLATNFATPGVNVLTLPVKVTPGFSHNMNTALVYGSEKFQAELGYNLYCRQSECVKLAHAFQEVAAIKARDGAGQTNTVRDITGNTQLEDLDIALASYTNSLIKESDLDLVSAATPCGISHTVYASFGFKCDDREYPLFVNVGGSYERGKATNGMVDRWTAWAKAGLSL